MTELAPHPTATAFRCLAAYAGGRDVLAGMLADHRNTAETLGDSPAPVRKSSCGRCRRHAECRDAIRDGEPVLCESEEQSSSDNFSYLNR